VVDGGATLSTVVGAVDGVVTGAVDAVVTEAALEPAPE
jgi:hypothetical protein